LFLSMDERYIQQTFPSIGKSNLKQKALLDKLNTLRYTKYSDLISIEFNYTFSEVAPPLNPDFNPSQNPELEEDIIDDSKSLLGTSNRSEQWNDDKLCKICLDEEKCMLTLPCRHISMCEQCVTYVKDCPICRSKIDSTIKVFSV
jgi:hypothetical protein